MRIPLEARYPDYDTKGHVNNAIYLTYFEIARARAWLEAMRQSADFPFVIAEATVRYRSEAMIGDPMEIEITTLEVKTKSWVWGYRVLDPRDERLIADGRTVQVMFDFAARRSIPVPDGLRALLATV